MQNDGCTALQTPRVSIGPWVRSTGDDDGYVILDIRRGLYHSLDGISARIWTHLRDGLSPRDAATRLAQLYGVERKRVLADVERFITQLEQKGLVSLDA